MSAHITMFNPAQRRVAVAPGPPTVAAKVVSVIGGAAGSSSGAGAGAMAAGATTTILAFGSSPPPAGLLPSFRPSHGDGARRRWRSRVAHPLRSLLVSVTDGDDDHRRPQRPDLH